MPLIDLSDTIGLGIILEHPNGVSYANQTGGTTCLHPTAVGYYVPLRNDCSVPDHVFMSPELDLSAYFEGPRHRGAGATSGLDEQDADFIDRVLARCGLHPFVSVDRARLRESHEAWVRIVIASDDPSPAAVFSDFGPYPRSGILTWSNSD